MSVSLTTVGNWYNEIEVPLQNALSAATETLGWSGYKACEKAIVYMAGTSAKLTKTSKKTRPIVRNPFIISSDGKKVKRSKSAALWGFYTYPGGKKQFNPLFSAQDAPYIVRFRSYTTGQPLVKNMRTGVVKRDLSRLDNGIELTKSSLKNDKRLFIKNAGLAKRSWMWGMKSFHGSKIAGVTDLKPFYGEQESGLVLTNRLDYMNAVVKAGYQQEAARAATNSIMFQAAKQLEKQMANELQFTTSRRRAAVQKKLASEFARARSRGTI